MMHGSGSSTLLKRAVLAISLLPLMILLTGSLRAQENTAHSQESTTINADTGELERTDDPDLPPTKAKIDKEQYMLDRQRYEIMKLGLDTAKPDSRAKAVRVMDQQEQQAIGSPALGIWSFVGPNPLPNGQTSGFSAAVSGRTISIAVDPTDANIVWAGTAQGGLYRSMNGGASWTQMFDNALSLAVGAITIAPSNRDIVYVGTGENGGCADCFFGVGVYRITNATSASPLVEGPFNKDATTNADVLSLRSVSRILVDPTNPDNIFVATSSGIGGNPGSSTGLVAPANRPNQGLYRSTNATSASPVFQVLDVIPGFVNLQMSDAVMDPADPKTVMVWVALSATTAPLGGVYRTTNALDALPTFTRVLTTATSNVRGELHAVKVGGNATTVYLATGETTPAGTRCSANAQGALHKSTDGGATWSARLQSAGGFCSAQCFYDIYIGTPVGDDQRILLGGGADSGSANPCRSSINQLSTDGSGTFTRKSTGLHADSHAVAFAPSNPAIAYAGDDGGIFKSIDGGNTWTSLNNSTFIATQYQSIAQHSRDATFFFGGTQDNGSSGILGPTASFVRVDGGDGGYALIDQSALGLTDVTLYHTYFNQTNTQIGFARVTRTADAVVNAWPFFGNIGGATNNGIGNDPAVLFYAPMAQGPGTPNTLYFGTDRLYRSTNKGTTMVVASQAPIVAGSAQTTIAISPQDDNVRLVGLTNGQVWGTTTGSTTLTNLTPVVAPLFPARVPNRLAIDPNNSSTAYVAFGGFAVTAGQHIWKTTTLTGNSATWSASGAGIPDVPVDSLAIDPQDSNTIFAGTDIGVYASTDGGATWNPYATGLPRVAVFDLAIQNQNRLLRAATHGRGIWEIAIPGTVIQTEFVAFTSQTTIPTTGNGNAFLEPGEHAATTINLTASGNTTPANVSVTITSPTPGITITNGTVIYPSVAIAGTTSSPTPFTFNIDPSVLCGTGIVFNGTITYADSSSPQTFTYTVPTGGPGTSTDTAYAGTPVAIPDSPNPGITVPFTVSGIGGLISKVTFSIDGTTCNTTPASTTVGLDHTFVGDLQISLVSPAGTTVVLTPVSGNAGINFCNTLFDDAAPTAWISVTAAQAPFTGSFSPFQSLAAFKGQNANGVWQLKIADGGGGDVGSIRNFSIHVTEAVCAFVAPAPVISSLSPNTACQKSPDFTLTVNGSNFQDGAVVRWNGSNRPTTFGSSGQLTALISSADLAVAGNVAVTVLNPDGLISLGSTFVVNPLPDTPIITAATSTTFCDGGSVKLSSSSPTGNQWFLNDTAITTDGNGQDYFAKVSGNYTVRVTDGNGCFSTSAPTPVTVNPLPATPTISSGNTTFCLGGSVTLTSSSDTGNQWYLDGTAITTNGTGHTYIASVPGNYTVRVTDTNGCMSLFSEATPVIVNPLPDTPMITVTGDLTFCDGFSVKLSSSSATGNQWYRDDNPITTDGNGQDYIAKVSGKYTVRVTDGNTCTSAPSEAKTVVVNPLPVTPTITTGGGATTFCVGGSVTLTSSSDTGNQWYVNGTAITTNGTGHTYVATVSGSYTVRVTDTNGCMSAPSGAVPVLVNALPATPAITAGGDTTFCDGGSVTLSSSNATGYQWYRDGAPITTDGNGRDYIAKVSGNYTVRVTDGNGCTSLPSAAKPVTVNPLPATPAITAGGDTTFCFGGSVTLTSSTATAYQWYLNDTAITTDGNGRDYIAKVSGNYTVRVTDGNGCMSAASDATPVTVNQIPATPTPTNDGPYVVGNTIHLFTAAVSGASYQWTGPAGFSSTAQNPTIPSATIGATGTYSVTVTVNNCTSLPGSTQVLVTATAPTGVVATATTTTSVKITWQASAGASSYEVLRRGAGTGYGVVGTTLSLQFVDGTAQPAKAYLYIVRAVDSNLNLSPTSGFDLATTVMFAPITPTVTPIRASDFDSLRTATNAVRELAGHAFATFTDPSLSGVAVKKVHIDELRTALDEARSALSLSAISYGETITANTTPVRAAHVFELEGGVQ